MVANLAAIAGAAWAAQRVGGQRAMVLTTALSAGLAWSLGSELLFDPWQPHAMLLPFWCLLVMCWALAAGDLLMAPFVVAIASLLVQTHLSFVYVVAIIGAATVVMTSAGLVRMARAGGAVWDAERSWLQRIGLWTAGVAVLAWCQPLSTSSSAKGTSAASWQQRERRRQRARRPHASGRGSWPPSSPFRRGGRGRGSAPSSGATGVVDDPKGRDPGRGRRRRGRRRAGRSARRRCRARRRDRGRTAVALPADPDARRACRGRRGRGAGVDGVHAHRGHRHQPSPDALAVADLRLRPPGRGGRGR